MLDSLKFKNWKIVKVYRDLQNYFDWRSKIRNEEKHADSKFTKWKLQRTKLFDVYTIVTLDDSDIPLPEVVKRTKVIEILNPIHRYLDEDLGFAECINCEFNQFYNDKGDPTLSYLIVYSFDFKHFSFWWLVRFLLIISVIIFIFSKFELIPLFFTWISNLIGKI